jgi:Spy/CpxP family protein refolding chaperone
MKRNWLLYLVIFSLALNLGTIGTFAYLRYQDRQQVTLKEPPPALTFRGIWGGLNLDDEQRQALRGLLPDHRRRVMQIRGELAQKRQELFDLIKGEASPWTAIQAKVQEISALQGGLEEEMARFLLEFKKHLRPEQHAAFFNLVQERLGRAGLGPHGPMGGPGSGRGRGMGLGRGMGPGPGPKGPQNPPEAPKP